MCYYGYGGKDGILARKYFKEVCEERYEEEALFYYINV